MLIEEKKIEKNSQNFLPIAFFRLKNDFLTMLKAPM
jgi:hypothetical protein